MAKEEKKEVGNEGFDAKEMLLSNAENGTIVRYNDRMEVRIIKDGKHLKAGKVYSPHKVKALALIAQGFAEKITKE